MLRPRCWSGRNSTLPLAGGPLRERPVQRGPGVGRRADRAAVPPGERLDRRGRVHVRDGHDVVRHPGVDQVVPGVLDLADRGHVGHRAAGREVRQHDLLVLGGQDVGALGHEVHAAEHDVRRVRPGRGLLGQLERVAGDVGELDDLVALVVVAEHEHLVAERGLGQPGPAPPGRGRTARAGRPGTRRRARWPGHGRVPSSSRAAGVGGRFGEGAHVLDRRTAVRTQGPLT